MMRLVVLGVLMSSLVAALAVACGDDGGEAEVSPTASAAGEATSTTAVVGEPSATSNVTPTMRAVGEKVLFLRGSDFTGHYPIRGPLWIANIDGSDAVRITPDGVVVTFGDIRTGKDGVSLVYFVAHGALEDEIRAYDVSSGVSSLVLSGEEITFVSASAASSWLAFTQAGNLNLLDVATGEVRRLLDGGDREACADYEIGECRSFYGAWWSPDGRLLAASEGLWEGARQHVVDPFGAERMDVQAGRMGFGGWSPESDAVCTAGQYGGPSALAINRAPYWEAEVLFADYEDWMSNPNGTSIQTCAWMTSTELVVLRSAWNAPNLSEISMLDLVSGEPEAVASFDDSDYCCTRQIVLMPGSRRVITQSFDYMPDTTEVATQPEVVDLDTGETLTILEPGDWVVGVVER